MSNIDIVRRLVDGAWRTVPAQSDTGGGGGSDTLSGLSDVTGEPGAGKAPVYDDSGEAPLTHVATTEDVDKILAGVAAVEWVYPELLSEWRNTGDPWCPVRWRRTLNNVVHIEGQATNDNPSYGAATWLPIFQLPPECLPGESLRFGCLCNDNAIGKIIVWKDGLVLWGGYMLGPVADYIPYVSLDVVQFSVGVA